WSEPYAAIRILGDGKLYVADENGNKNPNEWMSVIELIRHETANRIVKYQCQADSVTVDICVNESPILSVSAAEFLAMADQLAEEIKNGRGSFELSETMKEFLRHIEMTTIKAKSVEKSDVFLTITDPRASITREHIGFSIKSEFGQNPTLFNTAKASAVVYRVEGMTEELKEQINNLVDEKGHAAVGLRCDMLQQNGCSLVFVGFPLAFRAGCAAFGENLELLNPALPKVIERILWNYFLEHDPHTDICDVVDTIVRNNPCELPRPEVRYPYMIKSFLYAAYCGLTASTLWDGTSQVNGGFIKVHKDGDVIAHYALESDAFKSYLYQNCYVEFPSTDEKHGHYAKVYEENGKYYFRLNFQIRYR
ncbi:MAG: HpaII family restriction endonuclease, partial [Anaerovoracaceae bacterium]